MTSHTAPLVDSPPLRRIAVLLGWLSLFVSLALLSPGVVLKAHAEEALEGASCQAGQTPERISIDLEQTIEQLRAQNVQGPADDRDDYVVLNNRGYFYGPERTPSAIGLEAEGR